MDFNPRFLIFVLDFKQILKSRNVLVNLKISVPSKDAPLFISLDENILLLTLTVHQSGSHDVFTPSACFFDHGEKK